jgi:hypothetical protein
MSLGSIGRQEMMWCRLPTTDTLVPQSLEDVVCASWSKALDTYNNTDEEDEKTCAALLFTLFPSVVFVPYEKKTSPVASQNAIRDRCTMFADGDFKTLHEEAMLKHELFHAKQKAKSMNLNIVGEANTREAVFAKAEERAIKLFNKGQLSKAVTILESAMKPEVPRGVGFEDVLRALHPACSTGTDLNGNPILDDDLHTFVAEEDILVEVLDILNALKKVKRGKEPGASKCRYEHLKVFLLRDKTTHLYEGAATLTPLLSDLCNGKITIELASLLGNSDLVAITKPDGNPRPLGLLETLRNMSGNIVLSKVIRKLRATLFGKNFAVGVKGGIETAIHAFRTLTDEHPELTALVIDFSAMFQEISRNGCLRAIMEHCPEAFPFMYKFYSRSAKVAFRIDKETINNIFVMSENGIFQGDVWGTTAACCLLLQFQRKLEAHLNEFQEVANSNPVSFHVDIAVADDWAIVADHVTIKRTWNFLMENAPPKDSGRISPEPHALKINMKKTVLYSAASSNAMKNWFPYSDIPACVKRISKAANGGIRFLGSPVGSDDFCKVWCNDNVLSFKPRVNAICNMKNKQVAFLLFRLTHTTRLCHVIRTTPPDLTEIASSLMDRITEAGFCKILGVSHITASQMLQASLSIKQGGLGLGSAERSRVAAYAGSVAQCNLDLVDLETNFWPTPLEGIFTAQGNESDSSHYLAEAETIYDLGKIAARDLQKFTKLLQPEEGDPPVEPIAQNEFEFPKIDDIKLSSYTGLQKVVTKAMNTSVLVQLLQDDENLNDEDKRRILSAGGHGAGAFLTAFPVRPDLAIEPLVFVDALCLRIGIPLKCLLSIPLETVCACGKIHDYTTPSDIISCTRVGSSSWVQRHNRPALKLAEIARKAGHVVTVEKRVGVFDKSRVDVTINDYVPMRNDNGQPIGMCNAHLDFAVTNPTNASNSALQLVRGKSAQAYAVKKMRSPGALNVMAPDVFVPCILETFGLVHYDLRKVLSNLAESHIYLSVRDAGYTAQQLGYLKGAIMNEYQQLMSVSLMKGVVCNIQSAARNICRKADRVQGRGMPITTARAWCMIGAAERSFSSPLAEF